MELTYSEHNGVLIPDLVLDDQPPGSLGKYGRMRKRFLEQKHNGTFSALVLSGKLTEHLLDIDRTAREQLEATVSRMAAAEGVTECLKATDQMEWLRRINSIRNRAEEVVKREIIYDEELGSLV